MQLITGDVLSRCKKVEYAPPSNDCSEVTAGSRGKILEGWGFGGTSHIWNTRGLRSFPIMACSAHAQIPAEPDGADTRMTGQD